jgi:hypothetical protein
MSFKTIFTCLAIIAPITVAQAQEAKRMNFVACPEFRPANGGCWTIEHAGRIYAINNPENGIMPQLLHKVLVEGEPNNAGPTVCGGQQFSKLWTSVLSEVSPECNSVLPALLGYAPPMNPITEQLLGMLQAPIPSPPPHGPDTFAIGFDFDGAFLAKKLQIPAEIAARYAVANNAREVVIEVGYGRTILDDGTVLTESRQVLDDRATLLVDAFTDLGFPKDRIRVAPFPAEPGTGPEARTSRLQVNP